MKPYPWLLSITLIFTCLYTNTDVIVTTNIDNPSGPIAGETTLRDAINIINSHTGGEVIAFAPQVSTIQLLEVLPPIVEQVTIDGLAQAIEDNITPGDCNLISSPIDKPEVFLSALRVTIDGSQIPNTASGLRAGLFFLSSSVDSIIRGIGIKNITGTDLSPLAAGVFATNIGQNITAECCIIENILCKNSQLTTTISIGLENITTVSKCYIKDITSSPLNLDVTPNITQTAPAIGTRNSQFIEDTRIECVSSGSIVKKIEQDLPLTELTVGSAFGISNTDLFSTTTSKAKGCFAGTGSSDETTTIQNCYISNIQSGSIDLLSTVQHVSLDPVGGIYLTNKTDSQIKDSVICNIQTGSAIINSSETLYTNGSFGIFINHNQNNACIQNNIIKCIAHGSIETYSDSTLISLAAGIYAIALPLVITDNTVSSIDGGCHITMKECSSMGTNFILNNSWGTSGIVAITAPPPAIKDTIRSPSNSTDSLLVICNNHVTTISGGTRTAMGSGSSALHSGSIGILSTNNGTTPVNKTIINNNIVTSISGTNFITKAPASESRLAFGTKGIFFNFAEAEACNNTVSHIQEGIVSTALHSIHYASEVGFSFSSAEPPILLSITPFPAETTGIAATVLLGKIQNNVVKNITGSQPTGAGITLASISIGISIASENDFLTNASKQPSKTKQIIECGSTLFENDITNNTISDITSHITRPAYGIYSNSNTLKPLTIAYNSIHAICGGGAALEEQIFGDINNSVRSLFCSPETELFNELILLPSALPYEPTSGIYLFNSNCITIQNNTIETVGKIENQARGITSTASNDIEIFENTISHIKGPGMFIGGGPLFVDSVFTDPLLASIRNVMYSNKTFNNTGKGIELGESNWDNFFQTLHLDFGSEAIPTITVIGNHNQPAPKIIKTVCNSRGTLTITARLNDKKHPNSDFIIQFFTNHTNSIPHGQKPITDFEGSEFIMTTNENGTAQKTFNFMPLAQIKNGDNITAHVTLIKDGSEDIGDTSEFGVEVKTNNIFGPLTQKPKPFMFNQFLCK